MWIIAENYIVQIEKVYDKKKRLDQSFYPMTHVKLKSEVYTVTEESQNRMLYRSRLMEEISLGEPANQTFPQITEENWRK